MFDLTGRAALVTGASRGIGLSVAVALAEAGASVALAARDQAALEKAAAGMRKNARGKIVIIPTDVADHEACTRMVETAVEELGRLDILINNAGLGIFKSIEEMSYAEWRQQIDVNLGAVWSATKAALPALKEAGQTAEGGWVVTIGSLASRNTFTAGTGYNASKFGVLGMTEAMMLDLRQQGIRVSIIMPGSVNTHFDDKSPQPERGWKLQPDDCARAVLHLLAFPKGAHVSRVEMRPAMPDAKGTRR